MFIDVLFCLIFVSFKIPVWLKKSDLFPVKVAVVSSSDKTTATLTRYLKTYATTGCFGSPATTNGVNGNFKFKTETAPIKQAN